MSTGESEFKWDVFLSHSAANKDVVRDIANRLKSDGVRIWFDEWEVQPGDSIPAKIEDGLEHSRVLVLCMSAETFGSDWAQLESHTFRFKDPLNHNRRFIPLRLDDTPVKGSLAQFSYIDWRTDGREQAYHKLLRSHRVEPAEQLDPNSRVQLHDVSVKSTAFTFSNDGRLALTATDDKKLRVWDIESARCIKTLESLRGDFNFLAMSPDAARLFARVHKDKRYLLDLESDKVLVRYERAVVSRQQMECFRFLASGLSVDEMAAALGLNEKTVRDHLDGLRKKLHFKTRNEIRHLGLRVYGQGPDASFPPLRASTPWVPYVAWQRELDFALRNDGKNEARLRMAKHVAAPWPRMGTRPPNPAVLSLATNLRFATFAHDNLLYVCEPKTAAINYVIEGHTDVITTTAVNNNLVATGSRDHSIRVWNSENGKLVAMFKTYGAILSVAWTSETQIIAGDNDGGVYTFNLPCEVPETTVPLKASAVEQEVQYTNAKVLLVGDSHAGKTGLSNRLALNTFKETDSTVGAWSTQWKQPLADGDEETAATIRRIDEDGLRQGVGATNVEREVWLWDFGGQADQRLIHQLYMDQTQVAALVFDPQKDDVFETLGQWDRDLSRADKDKPDDDKMTKLLVAGRCDAGGLRVARSQVDNFIKERDYAGYYPTSAKQDEGCKELKQAIIDGIKWENIPWRSSPVLFKRLKDEIIGLKDEGRVLLRFNELREVLSFRMQGEITKFTDAELKAVVGLLAGPGVVWELEFGSWVLLQPERISAYAQAVIQTVREDEFDRGCISEQRVLNGDLTYHSSAERLPNDEEQFVLLAMHQILVERGLCIRHQAESGEMLLMFPSYYRRERQEPGRTPAVQVSYTFNGFLDEIYATLVVKLHHTHEFSHDNLWRNAADFKTQTGKKSLGLRLIRKPEGQGELQAFFAEDMPVADKIIFSKYIHEHLLQSGNDVRRFRHYVCQNEYRGNPCGTTANRDVAMERLEDRGESAELRCQRCDAKLHLWDELEERFADDDIRQRVQDLREVVKIQLDTESKERVLVGDVISTVALAGQICREIQVSDWGIDAEVEFKNDDGEASAKRVWLQLKSGDSFLTIRKKDRAAIFKSFNHRQAKYWMDHAEPVMLLIRNSKGEVQWMDIGEELRCVTNNGEKQVRQIVFVGKRFDVMSVRRWRDAAIGSKDEK